MTAIALLWSTRKDIQSADFFQTLRHSGINAPVHLLLWDGRERFQTVAENDPASGGWALALAVYGSAAGHPSYDASSGHALALAGQVRNAPTLHREMVGSNAAQPDPASCLLDLLIRKGQPALQELSGEWALALLDATANSHAGKVSLCSDRVGSEPLYYAATHECFAAASSIRTTLALARKPVRMDREWMLACLASGQRILPESGDTPYADVKRLRPGGVLVVDHKDKGLQSDVLRFSLLETFVDLPVDAARLHDDLRRAARMRWPAQGPLGIAWTGGPGAVAVAALASEICAEQAAHGAPQRVTIYALEQSGQPVPAAAAVADALHVELVQVPWPEYADLEQRRSDLIQRTGLPLPEPFPAVEMDLLCEAMHADGIPSAWVGCGARSLLGISHAFAGEALYALARQRRLLPAMLLRHAMADGERSLGAMLADQLGFVLHSLSPRPYRSTREQARIELLSHHASGSDHERLLRFYKQCFSWREFSSPRRMQLQQRTRGDGPIHVASLRTAARRHNVDLAMPLLDQHLARYLRLPLDKRLARGQECPLLYSCLPKEVQALAGRCAANHASVERLAAAPAREDQGLDDSPIMNALFHDLASLRMDMQRHSEDDRLSDLPAVMDALVEWERACGVSV